MTWAIPHRCDICATNVKFDSFCDPQRLITKLYDTLEAQYANDGKSFPIPIPQRACESCLLKIESLLNNLVRNLLAIRQHSHGNMQTDPQDPKQSEVANEPPKSELHEYNCECHECQEKFGSLPLLVQVIEGQERSSQQQNASTSAPVQFDNSNGTSVVPESDSLAEPSTSYVIPSNHKKNMKCPHCDKCFSHRGDLNKHVRKHTGEQPYTCRVCNRKFAHTSNLNRHLKVHSGDKPFVCSVCNKNFSRKDKLDNHKKTKLCKKFSEKR